MNDITVETNNLELFENWGKTDPAITKQVNKGGGRTITAVDAYQQIVIMTEKFGPMGKWGFRDTITEINDASGMALFQATFFYPEGEFEIINSIDTWIRPRQGEPRRDPDWAKKLMTDCLTKAFSYLLMNADIFLGRFDDNRYVEERKKEIKSEREAENESLYKRALTTLEGKREIMGKEAYDKYKESLSLIKDNSTRLYNALKVINGIEESQKAAE